MAKAARIISEGKDEGRVAIHCSGCNSTHVLDKRWAFNGDLDKPTFGPVDGGSFSLLVTGGPPDARTICHSYIKDGMIQFLGDCTHSLKGQIVPLDDI